MPFGPKALAGLRSKASHELVQIFEVKRVNNVWRVHGARRADGATLGGGQLGNPHNLIRHDSRLYLNTDRRPSTRMSDGLAEQNRC